MNSTIDYLVSVKGYNEDYIIKDVRKLSVDEISEWQKKINSLPKYKEYSFIERMRKLFQIEF